MTPYPPENLLADYLRDFGATLLTLKWSDDEVNAALSFIRRALERGEALPEAVGEAWRLRKLGRLLPE